MKSVQLIVNCGNVNHAVSITGFYIYDSNYKIELPLINESLYIICSSSKY